MENEKTKKNSGDENKPVILAIDDSPDILRTLHLLLKDGYKVHTLSEPGKLKDLLNDLTPDLFILDYSMPELTGFELMPIIRSFPEHKNTPVIYLTSIRSADFYNLATRLGACDYIIKPINAEKLIDKIETHIRKGD